MPSSRVTHLTTQETGLRLLASLLRTFLRSGYRSGHYHNFYCLHFLTTNKLRLFGRVFPGLANNSILFCLLFTIKDHLKNEWFQQTHNKGLRKLFLNNDVLTPSTTDANLDCVLVENALILHWSLNVKSKQKRIELLARPGFDPAKFIKPWNSDISWGVLLESSFQTNNSTHDLS